MVCLKISYFTVMPIIGGIIDDGNERTSFTPSEAFSHQCKEFINADVDIENHKRINQEHENCLYDLVNLKHLGRDANAIMRELYSAIQLNSPLSDQQNSGIINTIQKFVDIYYN